MELSTLFFNRFTIFGSDCHMSSLTKSLNDYRLAVTRASQQVRGEALLAALVLALLLRERRVVHREKSAS